MQFIKILTVWLLISVPLFGQTGTNPKSVKVTGERWYNWNGSAWVVNFYDDYVLDSLGTVTQMIKYTYSPSGTLWKTNIYNRTDYIDYYTLSYYYSWSAEKEWGHYSYTYKYNMNDVKIGYIYDYFYNSIGGGYEDIVTFTYTYDGDKISVIDEFYDYEWFKKDGKSSKQLNYRTTFSYDSYGRIASELKQSYLDLDWIDKERTLWTYTGSTGTGINEIFKNTVWIFVNKKTRTLNASYEPSIDNKKIWSWGFWINSQVDYLYYNTNGNLYDTKTYIYDSQTQTYDLYKRHVIFFEDFIDPLTAPVNFASSFTDNIITLSWDSVNGATGYNIYSSLDPYGTFAIDSTGTLNGTQWTAPVSDTKKFYKVTATNEVK
ncbi:TPA: hypothetical protein DCR49_09840 [Candidatus Delongbacteria bacterium]|nr:hypothetical protein [Candidatus Delongbacteria bacterium]